MILHFILGILWGAVWHFSAYAIGATISRKTWCDVAGKTTGVLITLPFVMLAFWTFMKMLGFEKETIKKATVALVAAYFQAYIAGGVGKVIGTAIDEWLFGG